MKVKDQTQNQEQQKNVSGEHSVKEPARQQDDPVAATTFPRYSFGDTAIFSRNAFQSEIFINQEHDCYEQEADEVASRVVRISEGEKSSSLQLRSPDLKTNVSDHIGTLSTSYDKQNGVKKANPSIFGDVLKSAGQSLDGHTRDFMESRFGHDFSQVRIHADGKSADMARAINARAYATGNDIVFGRDQYAPEKPEGRRLLAHELTHVVQQRGRHTRLGAAGSESAMIKPPGIVVARAPQPQTHAAPAPPASVAPGAPAFNVFEVAKLNSAAAAMAAFDAYLKLNPNDQKKAVSWSYSTGKLQKALALLGPSISADPKYADAIRDILRWIEETETRKATGKTDAQMSKLQAGVIKDKGKGPPDWGSAEVSRWENLTSDAQKEWTERGKKAITSMVAYGNAKSPELKLSNASFELAFHAVDKTALGALATVGTQSGKTVRVGFEFVVTVELNPAYALSTVVHELQGHPTYDKEGEWNYGGQLYSDAAAQVPANRKVDRSGVQTFNYWQSEIYSLLRELPYWTSVKAADANKSLTLPDKPQSPQSLNYDPRGAIEVLLKAIKKNWHPSLVNGIVRGFYKRIANDPGIQKMALENFEAIVQRIFGGDADVILK